ncbi:TolC family protein, partial [Pasteurellaceae bacterium LIM206]|nr:TolC family protein [Pasteurellaceae bacterium LIM206]
KMNKHFSNTLLTVLLCGLSLSPVAMAKVELKSIIQKAMANDPTLDEAKANIAMAQSQTKISEAGHLPVVALTGTSVINQYHRDTSDRHSGPGVNARLNLYAWGGIEAEIERDRHKEGYYQHKLIETREIMGQRIGQLYLTALRAKESIAAYQESLIRHEKILKDLNVIVRYDSGRQSDVNEALSRRNQVESALLTQQRIMQSALNQLTRYTRKPISEADLVDPFAKIAVNDFIKRYHSADITFNPSYQAQQKEFDSAAAAVRAAKARQMPAINLEGNASRHNQEIYINMSWDIYNPANEYTKQQSYYSQQAAEAKLREIELDIQEKALTSEVDMVRSRDLARVAHKQIALQRKVVADTEMQFEIANRSLLNVLDAYQELTGVQMAGITARNDFRDAALLYLASQAKIAGWAGDKVRLDFKTF